MFSVEKKIRSFVRFLTTSVLVGTLAVAPYLTGCRKSDEDKNGQQGSTGVKTPHYAAELKLVKEKIQILRALIKDFEYLKIKFQKESERYHSIFTNSIEQTLVGLKEYEKIYAGDQYYGLVIPLETLVQSEIKPTKHAYTIFHSIEYWHDLQSSLQNYGYLESGKLTTPRNVVLMAKRFFKTSFPSGVHLITDDPFRGFFVGNNGDLVVPGKKFYQDVLEGRIGLDLFPTTPFYYKTLITQGENLIAGGKYDEGIRKLQILLDGSMVPKEGKATAFYNVGFAYEKKENLSVAIKHYTSSIKTNQYFSHPYYRRARLLCLLGRYSDALDSFNNALKIETEPNRILQIKKGIELCNEVLNN